MERVGVRIQKEHAKFSAGHFLVFADGTSEPLHGHDYRLAVEVEGRLDRQGLLIDFGKLKEAMEQICRELDLRTLLPTRNRFLKVASGPDTVTARVGTKRYELPREDTVLLPIANTSCELLARHVCETLGRSLGRASGGRGLRRIRITLEEAPGELAICERTL
ncbi:MAG: 6-carboxytetrahydropterin synthase [Nitrospirae bacterium]|nr:6-carboxytetrahydropterin synthase [Nitrospirota bacterium]